ncbi:peptidoglycan-binding domain-containing protein [Cohaesibacter celericrescens]|nr:peptidoglycan-binding domain-containing protein [Cohaesibacter celericrescens]
MSETYDDYESWEDEGQDSPIALVGILVMVLTSAAIIANALFMQPKSAEIELINRASKSSISQQNTGTISANQSAQNNKTPAAALQADQVAMTLAVQRQLTMSGYYVGPLDGMEGSQTREAILAYQDAMGMPATGRVSLALHDILIGRKQYIGDSAANRVATTALEASGTTDQEAKRVMAILPRAKPASPQIDQAPAPRIAVKPPVVETNLQLASGPIPPERIPAAPKADPILAKVQSALQRFGYGNLSVDGLMGSRTRSAIADFQRSRGHPVTGAVNDRLLQEMMIMGYLDLG